MLVRAYMCVTGSDP